MPHAVRVIFSILALSSLLAGCGYVGSKELNEALCLLDEDGDGVPLGGSACAGIEWEDSLGKTHVLGDVIEDCDDDSEVLPMCGGNSDRTCADFKALCDDRVGDIDGEEGLERQRHPVVEAACDCANSAPAEGCTIIKGKLRTPRTEDIPYDGINNDCVGADNVDMDGDTYPGITQEEWSQDFNAFWGDRINQSDWPATVLFSFDCVDQSETADTDIIPPNQIFPNNPTDTPYNDIDEDCAKDNDFDADGDGFASVFEATAYAASQSYVAEEPATDCDDARSDVYPGIDVEDVPYDGKDRDCNDVEYDTDGQIIGVSVIDFDKDDDGWLPFGVWNDFVRYAEAYEYGSCGVRGESGEQLEPECGDNCLGDDINGDGTIECTVTGLIAKYLAAGHSPMVGDCYDKSDSVTKLDGSLPPEAVHPGAPDEAHDGYDDDCSDIGFDPDSETYHFLGNDFDDDADGYLVLGNRENFLAYIQRYYNFAWPIDGVFPYREVLEDTYGETLEEIGKFYDQNEGDCEDKIAPGVSDPAAINPGALEIVGDSTDQDCDVFNEAGNREDTARFNFTIGTLQNEFTAVGASRPLVAAANDHYIVLSQVESFKFAGEVAKGNVGLAFFVDREDDDEATSNLPAFSKKTLWDYSTESFNGELGGITVNGSDFAVGYSYISGGLTYLAIQQFLYDPVADDYSSDAANLVSSSRTSTHNYTGIDFQYDSSQNLLWLLGCNSNGIHYLAAKGRPTDLQDIGVTGSNDDGWPTDTSGGYTSDPKGAACFMQMKENVGAGAFYNINTVSSGGIVSTYNVNTSLQKPKDTPVQPWTSLSLQSPYTVTNDSLLVHHGNDDRLRLALAGNTLTTINLPNGATLLQADAALLNSDVYVAAIYKVTAGGSESTKMMFAYGNPSSLTVVNDFPVLTPKNYVPPGTTGDPITEGQTLTPKAVGIAVDEDRVILAVTTETYIEGGEEIDFLGWTIMGSAD